VHPIFLDEEPFWMVAMGVACPREQLEKVTGLMPFFAAGLLEVIWRSDYDLIEIAHCDRFFGQEQETDRVAE
jgi:hypothetical protein